jgi:hypothetical protein
MKQQIPGFSVSSNKDTFFEEEVRCHPQKKHLRTASVPLFRYSSFWGAKADKSSETTVCPLSFVAGSGLTHIYQLHVRSI